MAQSIGITDFDTVSESGMTYLCIFRTMMLGNKIKHAYLVDSGLRLELLNSQIRFLSYLDRHEIKLGQGP